METTPVRCMIRHWATSPELRLPKGTKTDGYMEPPFEPVFEDERQTIAELPLPPFLVKKSSS